MKMHASDLCVGIHTQRRPTPCRHIALDVFVVAAVAAAAAAGFCGSIGHTPIMARKTLSSELHGKGSKKRVLN